MRIFALVLGLLPAIAAAQDDWIRYESGEHQFSVTMPSEPKPASSPKAAFTVNADGPPAGVNYAVDVFLMPGLESVGNDVIRTALLASRDATVGELNGKLVTDCEIIMFDKPGRAFSAEAEKDGMPVFFSCRVFPVGHRLFLLRITQYGPVTASLKDAMKFFGSFRLAGNVKSESNPADPIANATPYGEWGSGSNLSFRIQRAAVERVKVHRTISNDYVWSDDNKLIITLAVRNDDERRIVRVRNQYMKTQFGLFDDANNLIRGVSYGVSAIPAGQMRDQDDLNPKAATTTVDAFNIPPAPTRYLIVFVDLSRFGQKGAVILKLPLDKIENYPHPIPTKQ